MVLSAQAPPAPAPLRRLRDPQHRRHRPFPRRSAATGTTPALDAAAERDLLNRYCVGCHSERAKAAGMDSARKISLDSIDLTNVHPHAEKLELVVRKLRAGMMPPAGARRPEPAVYKSMTSWLENELDRTATPYTPPPGLHRLNRTEYANAVRDLLDLDIDPAKYLPSDDSTHGFDNIAGTLGISSTLVEAYVSAAGKISRLAIGEATPPTLVVYRTPEDSSQDYHIEGLPFGTRGGMLVNHEFPSDGEYTITVTPIFGDNMSPTGFGSVPCEKLEVILDGERLELLDWQGGGRFGVPTPNCGRGRGAAAPRPGCGSGSRRRVQPQRGAQDDRPLQDDGRSACGRRDVPADQLRAAARPRSALPARHAADRADAGFHVLPACRNGADRRALQRDRREGFAEPPEGVRVPPGERRRGNGVRPAHRHRGSSLAPIAGRRRRLTSIC